VFVRVLHHTYIARASQLAFFFKIIPLFEMRCGLAGILLKLLDFTTYRHGDLSFHRAGHVAFYARNIFHTKTAFLSV